MCLQSRSKHADVSMFYSTRQRLFESAKAQSLETKICSLFRVFCTTYACCQRHVKAFVGRRGCASIV